MTQLLSWLLEEDDPGVRYLAMRDLKAAQASPQALAEAGWKTQQMGNLEGSLGLTGSR